MKEQKRKTAIYLRVSTSKQAAEGYGLDAQLDRCMSYCAYRQIPKKDIVVYSDEGYSAKSVDRPDYKRMIRDIHAGKLERVVIFKLDRISRSIVDFSKILNEYASRDTQLISVSENIDLNSASGALIAKILVIFAEYERNIISERTVEGMRAMVMQGKYPFAQPPFGYRFAGKYCLEVDEGQKEAYLYMVRSYLETESLAATFAMCERRYPEYSWSYTGITERLKNPAALGGIQFHGEYYPDSHEPIIDRATFDKVNRLMERHARPSKNQYVYQRLIWCEDCDRMAQSTTIYKSNGKKYIYYQCPCCGKRISESAIDDQADRLTSQIELDDEIAPSTLLNDIRSEREEISEQIRKCEIMESGIMENALRNDCRDMELVKEQLIKVMALKKDLKKKLAGLDRSISQRERHEFNASPIRTRRFITQKTFDKIYVNFRTKKITNVKLLKGES